MPEDFPAARVLLFIYIYVCVCVCVCVCVYAHHSNSFMVMRTILVKTSSLILILYPNKGFWGGGQGNLAIFIEWAPFARTTTIRIYAFKN